MWISIFVVYVLGIVVYIPWAVRVFAGGNYDNDYAMVHLFCLWVVWPIVVPLWLIHRFWKWCYD